MSQECKRCLLTGCSDGKEYPVTEDKCVCQCHIPQRFELKAKALKLRNEAIAEAVIHLLGDSKTLTHDEIIRLQRAIDPDRFEA